MEKNSNIREPIFKDVELLYRTYFNGHIIKFIIDAEGRIISVNNKFTDELNCEMNKILKTRIYDLLFDGTGEALKSEITKINNNNTCYKSTIQFKEAISAKFYELELSKLKDNILLGSLNELKENDENGEINLLKLALESTNNAVLISDSEGVIEWVNQSFTRITQYTLDEVKGQNPRILKSGVQDEKFYTEMWDTIKKGTTWEGQLFNKRKDGSIYLDGQKIIPFKNENKEITHFIAIKSDISEQSYTNDKLLSQDQLLNLLTDAIITTDEKFNITGINKGAEDLLETKKTAVFGKNVFEIVTLGKNEAKRLSLVKSLSSNDKVNFTSSVNNKSSKFKSLEINLSSLKDNSGNITAYICIIKNNPEKKEFADKSRLFEQFLNSVFDSISDPVVIFDRDLKIRASNKIFLSRFNILSEDIYQKKLQEVVVLPEQYIKTFEEHLIQVFKEGNELRITEEFHINKNNKIIESWYFPINQADGKVSMVVLIYKDLSAVKASENADEKFNKLEIMGKMAAYISHEMKTPLNSIKMNIDLLSKLKDENPQKERSFQLLQKEVNRLSRLMKDVLQFSQTNETDMAMINIRNIVDDIHKLLAPLLKKKSISLINKIEDRSIPGLRNKLNTVFFHLVENSMEAIEYDGEIILTSEYDKIGNEFRVFIEDNGIGIEAHEKIFEPFYTTKSNGTGLGLAIISNILEANKAKISLVKSNPGRTIFELKFPCE